MRFSSLYRRAAAALLLLFATCAAHAAEPLRLAAAADLQPVLPPILAEFQQQTGIVVQPTFGASATLVTQLENGAPFDLFLSADTSFPERLIADKLAVEARPVVYARGTLVFWARNNSPLLRANANHMSLDLLRSPALQTLAIANPDRAPYGRAARAALVHRGLLDTVTPHLVTADNIAQAAQFAATGNADAGLISLTSASTPEMRFQGQFVEVPAEDYPPILQGAVTLRRSAETAEARRFFEFLQSAPVREQLKARGLAAPQ